MTTKEAILYKALIMFSEKGYEGVSMRDIASEVGIKLHQFIIILRAKKIFLIV